MRNKVIAMMGIIVTVGVMVPTNLIGYATSDINYVESVGSEISVAKIEIDESGTEENSNKQDVINDNIVVDIADVLGMEVEEELKYSLVFGEELLKYNVVFKSTDSEEQLEDRFKDLHEVSTDNQTELASALGDSNIVDLDNQVKEIEEVEAVEVVGKVSEKKEIAVQASTRPIIKNVDQSDALLQTAVADENYRGVAVQLTEQDRDILERLVMGEAGAEGYEGAALVAQAIRDTMVYKGFNSVEEIRIALKYSGSINKEPNQDVKNAVAFIFDEGGMAVKHTVFYFYAPKLVSSAFHESQLFIIEHKGHRFFSNH